MRRISLVIFALPFALAACSTELAHESSYDPDSPLEKQARSTLTGSIQLEGETDFSQVTVELQNEVRTYSVDTAADGSVKLTGIVPGSYRLSVRTRYFEPVTQDVTIDLAEKRAVGPLMLKALRSDVFGSALVERLEQEEKITGGGASLTLKKTGSIRSGVSASPRGPRAMAQPQTVEFQAVSGAAGDYRFSGVPVGTYEVVAAATGMPTVTIPNVRVTGEGDVSIEDVVLAPVTGFFRIAGKKADGSIDYAYTATSAVTLELTGINAPKMQIGAATDGTAGNCQLGAERTLEALQPWNFGEPEGVKTVCVRYVGEDGTNSRTLVKSILYDRSAPNPVVLTPLFTNGYVKTDYLLVNVAAVDSGAGLSALKLGTGPGMTTAATLPFQPTLQVALGGDGAYVRYLWVLDAAGNASAMQTLAVTVDTQKPVPATALSVNGGASETNERLVSVAIDVPDAVEMQLSESSSFAGAIWQPITPSTLFTLSSGDGSKTVWARYRDAAGNVSNSDGGTIWLDRTAPANLTVSIAEPSPSNVSEVTLTITASGNATHMQISENVGFLGAIEEPYTAGPLVRRLAAGDGLHAIYVRVRDSAGNWSALAGASIFIDTAAPSFESFTIVTPSGAESGWIRSTSVTLTLSALSADQYQAAEGAFCGGSWSPFTTATSVLVSSGNGPKSVSVRYRDAAGNQSLCLTKSVTLDETLPTGSIALEGNAAETNSRTVDVALSVSVDASHLMISESASFSDADWRPVTSATQWTCSAADGNRRLYLRLKDRAGNLSADFYDDILLDTIAPADPSIALEGGLNLTNKANINVSAVATGANYVRVANSSSFNGSAWLPYPAAVTWHPLTAGDGLKTVYVQFKDEAGNLSAVVSDTIVKDTLAPADMSLAIQEAPLTKNSTVTAVFSAAGADEVQLSGDIVGGATGWLSNRASLSVALSAGNSTKVVSAQWRDLAGNYSSSVTAWTVLDQLRPGDGSVVIGSTELTNNPNVTLALTYGDAVEMMLANASGFVGGAWEPVAGTKAWTLSAGDGLKIVYVKYRDSAGNESQNAVNDTITLDTTPPTGASFTISEGAATTNRTISLGLSAVGASQVLTGNDSSFSGSTWRGYAAAVTHYLTDGDGLKVVYVKYRDAAGNETAVFSQVTELDTGAPAMPQIVISSGAEYTKTETVTLHVSAAGAAEMTFSSDGAAYSAWEPFASTLGFPLPGTDGTKFVYVKFRDAALNETVAVFDTIFLDRSEPTGTSVVIAGGEPYARSQTVILSLSASGASQMQVSEDNGFTGVSWEPYSGAKQYVLSSGQGPKTVYARFKDDAGWVTNYVSDGIALDSVAPGSNSLAINGGAASTNVTGVTLTIATNDLAAEMRISESSDFEGAAWESYSSPRAFTLSTGDGTKAVYLQLRDAAGNESGVVSKFIQFDKQGPTGASVLVSSGAQYTTAAGVTLSMSGNGATEMQVSENAAFTGAAWVPFATTYAYVITGGEGTRHVYLRLRDAASNYGAPVSDSIWLDTQAPTIPTVSIVQQPSTRSTGVNLVLSAGGATELILGDDAAFGGRSWQPYTTSTVWALPPGDGTKTVYAKYRDAAGNVSGLASDSTLLDGTAPTVISFLVNAGLPVTNSSIVSFAVSVTEALSSPIEMQSSSDPSFAGKSWVPFTGVGTFSIPPGDGYRTVYIRFRDSVGNSSMASTASFLLDQTPPQISSLLVNDSNYYAAATIPISVQIGNWSPGDVLDISEDAGFATAVSFAVNAGSNDVDYALSAGDETKDIFIRARDVLGNAGTIYPITVMRDTVYPLVLGPKAVVIEADSDYATSRFASVDLNVSGASQMQLSEGPSFFGAAWEPFQINTLWVLSNGDTVKTLYARFRDDAGNTIGDYHDEITLDTVAPSNPGLLLAAGQSSVTNSTVVALQAEAVGATDMELADNSVFFNLLSIPYATATMFTLPAGDGIKTIFVRFADPAGNLSSIASVNLTLDQTAPQNPSVGLSGASLSNQLTIPLTVGASGADYVSAGDGACMNGEGWHAYATSITAALSSSAQGPHTLAVCFKDVAGNVAGPVTATVVLDTVPPVFSADVTGPEGVLGLTAQQLAWATLTGVSGDAVQIMVSNFAGFAGTVWQPINTVFPHLLLSGDGAKTVYVKIRDEAGNESAVATPTIVLDQTGPDAPGLQVADVSGDGFALSSTSVELRWSVPGDIAGFDLQRFVQGVDENFVMMAAPLPSQDAFVDDVTATVGNVHNYRIRAFDALGNISAWSIIASAQPIKPITEATWIYQADGSILYSLVVPTGTFSISGEYQYEDLSANGTKEVLPRDRTSWIRLPPGSETFNEKLVIRNSNRDNSLVQESEIDLQLNQRMTLDSDGTTGAHASLALDPFGNVHISYYDQTEGALKYAYKVNGSWVISTLATGGVGSETSLALDAAGKVHISYYDNAKSDLMYATNATGGWAFTTIDGDLGITFGNHSTSLALDSAGKVHIAFYDKVAYDLRYATNVNGYWETAPVDTTNSRGEFNSIAVDSTGALHISYYDSTNRDLMYATYVSGGWATSALDVTGDVGSYTSLAVDSGGRVHISYYDTTNTALKYATNVTGPWTTTTLDDAGGTYTSLVVDPFDTVHISYGSGNLKYATNVTGGWQTRTLDLGGTFGLGFTSLAVDGSGKAFIAYHEASSLDLKFTTTMTSYQATRALDSVGNVGAYGSLAIDSAQRVHIGYLDATNGDLKYATNLAGAWAKQTIDSTGNVGSFSELALDSADKVHFCYSDLINMFFKYATNKSGAWEIATLDTGKSWGNCSIAVDAAGDVHASYYNATDKDLKYVTGNLGGWNTTVLDAAGWVGDYSSLAIDSTGAVHISYYDGINRDLKYANNVTGGWAVAVLDNSDYAGNYSSLYLDADDKLHVVYFDAVIYYDESRGYLWYATNSDGSWKKSMLDGTGHVGQDMSVAIDPAGKVHISYYDSINQDLRYLTNASGLWLSSTLDSAGNVGRYNSLAVDSAGTVHISYYDSTNLDLKYATGFSGHLVSDKVNLVTAW